MQDMVLTIIASVIASGGFWALVQRFIDKRSKHTKLLVGLAHDRIIYLASVYIKRGWITHEEYENLYDYLYIPYSESGGNGTAAKLVKEVMTLKMVNNTHLFEEETK